jgi:hypothetical protein
LLEKYKSMARDAQLAGDRVQSEYYLQFADHYFRVLSESRARFEEQNPRRQRDDDLDEDDGDDEMMDASGDDNVEAEQEVRPSRQRRERSDRNERNDRGDRNDRTERAERSERSYSRDDRSRDDEDERNGYDRGIGVDERLPLDVLPPAIGRDDAGESEEASEEVEVRPRRRTRRPRAQDGEGEIAPAA